jgi:predicted esterase
MGKVAAAALLSVALVVGVVAAPGPRAVAGEQRVDVDQGFYVAHGVGPRAVVVLHSLGHEWTEGPALGWSALADTERFLAVYPQARPGASGWNAGLCCGTAQQTDRDDVTFLAHVIADVKARYRVTRVYLTGYSNGGMMAERLLAEQPSLSDRFAVMGAAPEMPLPGQWAGRGFILHGAKDTTVPWRGGTVTLTPELCRIALGINPRLSRECGGTYLIRPGQATRGYLKGARLSAMVLPGHGHRPPPNWPALAWSRMNA